MAALFGEGATYDAIEKQFRKYRKQAAEIKAEAAHNGISLSEVPRVRGSGSAATTPKAPRTGSRGSIVKPSSSAKGKKGIAQGSKEAGSPTKRGSRKGAGKNLTETIYVESDDDDEDTGLLDPHDVIVKSEDVGFCVLPSIEPPTFDLAAVRIKTESKDEDQIMSLNGYTHSRGRSSASLGKSRVAKKDTDGDEEMASTPTAIRSRRESAPDRSLIVPLRDASCETDVTDEVA
ncbi:hypothetical protein BJX64DRAFT_261756 [Aspergillus heterothallicus]